MKRRTAILGLGSLLFGSGALSSASFNSAVTPESDIRAVAAKGLEIEAGDAFNDDGTVSGNSLNPSQSGTTSSPQNGEQYIKYGSKSFFKPNPSGELDEIDTTDLPVATVNKRNNGGSGFTNDDVKMRVAFDLEDDQYRFLNILRIENSGTGSVNNLAISFEYGDDVLNGGIAKNIVRKIFKFFMFDGTSWVKISPNYFGDVPNNTGYSSLGPGETRNIRLLIDLTSYGSITPKSDIRQEASLSGNIWSGQEDTVQLVDKIKVGTGWSN